MICEICKKKITEGTYINDLEYNRHIVCYDCYAKLECETY